MYQYIVLIQFPSNSCAPSEQAKEICVLTQRCSIVPSDCTISVHIDRDSDSISDSDEAPTRRPMRLHVAPDLLGVVSYDL